MNSALAGTDLVIYFESQRIYDVGNCSMKVEFPKATEVPIGEPDIRRKERTLLLALPIRHWMQQNT